MRDIEQLGKTIEARRLQKRYSQIELGHEIGKSRSYISKIENNQLNYPPSEETIAALAEALELDEYQLQLLAGHIPKDIKKYVIDFLVAYPKERARELLEKLFYSAIL